MLRTTALEKMMKQHKLITKMFEPTAIERMMKQREQIAKMFEPTAMERMMKQREWPAKSIGLVNTDKFMEPYRIIFKNNVNLNDLLKTINIEEFSFENINQNSDAIIQTISKGNTKLTSATNKHEFIELFNELPINFKQVFIYFLLYILMPLIVSISGNLLTPAIRSYISDNKEPKQALIENIKNIPIEQGIPILDEFRFISGDKVRLRQVPSNTATILHEMKLGQIVSVISEKNYWVEIKYQTEDGKNIQGWAYKGYIKKFN